MSASNVINENNLGTSEAIDTYFKGASMDYLKKARFDFGCKPSLDSIREALRLRKLICSDYCYLSEEQQKEIREKIIKHSILELNGL